MDSATESPKPTHRSRAGRQSCPLSYVDKDDERASSVPPNSTSPARSLSSTWYPRTQYRIPRAQLPYSFNVSEIYACDSYCKNPDHDLAPSKYQLDGHALYPRYTTQDWNYAQMMHCLAADKAHSASRRLRSDAVRLAQEKDEQAFNNHSESSKHLDDRIRDIEWSKNELEKAKNKMKCKIDDVELKQRQVKELLCETENMCRTAQENLHEREKRQGIDLVHDHVEQELIREVDKIKSAQHKLRQILTSLDQQNALNRASLCALDRDARNKSHAIEIDCTAHNLVPSSPHVGSSGGIALMNNTVSIPISWAQYTERNIHQALVEISQSDELINSSNHLMGTIKNDLWSQWNYVNVSLDNRIKDIRTAANKTHCQLEKTLQEITDVEHSIAYLNRSINDKEEFLKVARTRLEVRAQRPHVEACNDSAMQKLIQEVDDLYRAIEDLRVKLNQEENTLQRLLHIKSTLEKDLAIKQNSLSIDSDKILGMRRTYLTNTPAKYFLTRPPSPRPYYYIDL